METAGRLTHSWMPWKRPPREHERLGRLLDVQDARPGGHPLGGAVGDDPAAADRVLVLEDPVDHVGDGLEAPVGVPGGALGLAGAVVDLAHLVHVHERVEVGQGDAGEGAPDREALALEAGRGGGHALHRARSRRRRGIGRLDPREDEQVVDGDSGHGSPFCVRPNDERRVQRRPGGADSRRRSGAGRQVAHRIEAPGPRQAPQLVLAAIDELRCRSPGPGPGRSRTPGSRPPPRWPTPAGRCGGRCR